MCTENCSSIPNLITQEDLSVQLVSNLDYIKWLEDFTLRIPTFSDDFWKYVKNEISSYDEEKVKQLRFFLNGILDYCKDYLIDTNFNGEFETNRVHIKFNGIGYSLGLVAGQSTYVYVSREIANSASIDFFDITYSITPENLQLKCELLKSLESQIEMLKKYGIPKSEIINIVKMFYK